ncbi:MAG: hypothetical protein MJK10_17775 [Pseudomonadales bacterium]|nr:hypothetical protein [Pseudomonadales bacterium]NRA17984.1 hypothetical protein [Oceanospirillaceae bacterium]
MRSLHVLLFPLISTILIGFTTIAQAKSQWTVLERIERFSNQTHHWGQKGQVSANNGWSDYGKLKISLSNEKYLLLQQWQNELLLEVYSTQSTTPSFKALSIPGAGLFFSPQGSSNCAADSIQQAGMFAEMTLFYMAKLFPEGPSNLIKGSSFKLKGAQTEFRFMKLAVQINTPWSVTGLISMSQPGRHKLQITGPDNHPALVDWSQQKKQRVASSELLKNWDACWTGSHRADNKGGSRTFKTNISDTENIATFAHIREQLDN